MMPAGFVGWMFDRFSGAASEAAAAAPSLGCLGSILLAPVFVAVGFFACIFYTFRASYYVLAHDPVWRWVLLALLGLAVVQVIARHPRQHGGPLHLDGARLLHRLGQGPMDHLA